MRLTTFLHFQFFTLIHMRLVVAYMLDLWLDLRLIYIGSVGTSVGTVVGSGSEVGSLVGTTVDLWLIDVGLSVVHKSGKPSEYRQISFLLHHHHI